MPHNNSAKKRLRQNIKSRARNQSYKTRCKNSRKKFLAALEQENLAIAEESLKQCVSDFDRAAKTGAISRARANRIKSRLSRKASEARQVST